MRMLAEQISVFKSLTTTFAIGAVLRFHKATKPLTAHQRPMLKLIAFKSIVFLSWIQTVQVASHSSHARRLTSDTDLIHLSSVEW